MPYQHLNSVERDEIAQMHFSGLSFSEIGRRLGRHKSTISRELKRNRIRHGAQRYVRWRYLSSRATLLASQRRTNAKQSVDRVLDHQQPLEYVKRGLKNHRSPEQISGRIKRYHRVDPAMRVSHQTIYQWIRQDKQVGGK